MAAETGKRFIDFKLQNQDGNTVTLGDFAGKWLVVYVYPKDDTPGCTNQGKSFTATKQEFDDANIAVVGVSADDVASHKDFCNKFSFTIDLLADPKHELLDAAGVGQSEYKGTMYWNRTSFVSFGIYLLVNLAECPFRIDHERSAIPIHRALVFALPNARRVK